MEPALHAAIEKAAAILRAAGATDVYLFGSILEPIPGREPQDIDFAVKGLPPDRYYSTVGAMMTVLPLPVDVIDLDRATPFVRRLRESGRLRRVA